MQAWEYLTVQVEANFSGEFSVRCVNGVNVGGQRPAAHDYLNLKGRDGWEVAGVFGNFAIILKRPKP
jgi:hypothetical protein